MKDNLPPNLYPFKFKPLLKQAIWGGTKLSTKYHKGQEPGEMIAESWEIAAVNEQDVSEIDNGPLAGHTLNQILKQFEAELVGQKVWEKFHTSFPLLIKLIDAADVLSVQVHPDDTLAQKNHQQRFGKNELWYILETEPNATLVAGFNQELDQQTLNQAITDNKIATYLQSIPTQPGDLIPIPPGRVHAIGAGNLLVEIQQSSDLTYRFYDWDRLGADGQPRELHQDLAVEAVDLTYIEEVKVNYPQKINQENKVFLNEHFQVNLFELNQTQNRDFTHLDSFLIYVCVAGAIKITDRQKNSLELRTGESCLIPAQLKNITLTPLTPTTTLLETHL